MQKIIRKDNLIIIPSSLIYLAKVDDFVEKKLKKLGLNKDQLADIAISVTEVVNNAIVHGNKNDPAKKVTLHLETDESSITIEVEDEGRGFDLNTLPCPITEENLFKEVGRGIFILRSLMDKVDFIFKKEGGTVVCLTKYLKKDKKT
jgi:serine/threonine-protein kinase RsbW